MVIVAAAAGEIPRPLFVIGYAVLYGLVPCGINAAILARERLGKSRGKEGQVDAS